MMGDDRWTGFQRIVLCNILKRGVTRTQYRARGGAEQLSAPRTSGGKRAPPCNKTQQAQESITSTKMCDLTEGGRITVHSVIDNTVQYAPRR